MPDNQLTEETINGIYTGKERLRSNEGTRLLIKDDNFPNSEYTTGVSVFDSNTQLAEQVTNDLEPGMRVSLRISVKQGPNGKFRNLLEILNRVSNPTPQVAQAPQAPQTSGGYIPTPSDQWRADGQKSGNSITNGTALIIQYMIDHKGELPGREWMEDAALAVNIMAAHLRAHTIEAEDIVEEEPSIEGDNTEDNPF